MDAIEQIRQQVERARAAGQNSRIASGVGAWKRPFRASQVSQWPYTWSAPGMTGRFDGQQDVDLLVLGPTEVAAEEAGNRLMDVADDVVAFTETDWRHQQASGQRSTGRKVRPMSDVPRANTWVAQAANDAAHARYAMDGGFYAQSCYAGQQAVEKAPKALLLYSGQDIGRTHSIVSLCRALTEANLELPESVISRSEAQDLTRPNIETRYPLGDGEEPPFELFGQEQADRVVAAAERVADTVQQVLVGV